MFLMRDILLIVKQFVDNISLLTIAHLILPQEAWSSAFHYAQSVGTTYIIALLFEAISL